MFNTLQFANRLKAAGVPPLQAEAHAEAVAGMYEVNLQKLATKDDMQRAVSELRADMQTLEVRLVVKLTSVIVVALSVLEMFRHAL